MQALTPGVLSAVAILAASAGAASDAIRPDALMLQFPDVSQTQICFVYANDVWVVPKSGGQATQLAAPEGPELFPRFSPDGKTIAFLGNYEGDGDLYTIPVSGGIAQRVTYHPATEMLCDWTPDGGLLYSSNGYSGLGRAPKLFTVSALGGSSTPLPVPYGDAGAISPNGEWLAYTPHNRDFRTWKRYRGGMASEIWLFNLKNMTSRRVTTWEGTDTRPMWSPDGRTLYYLSDGGSEHRLNIWSYDVASQRNNQVTSFKDYDVKFPSIGPSEIVFTNGDKMYLLDLGTKQTRTVDVTIPGDRPTLRPKMVDYADYGADFDISSTGKRVVAEARGDIWSLPAEKGITRNLTPDTDGSAERDPIWSPDGKWVAYLSDRSGEYEIYVQQSDGKGDVRQLTHNGDAYRYMHNFSPDSKKIVYGEKDGSVYLLDVESGEAKKVAQDMFAQQPAMSWAQDSNWIAFALSTDNQQRAIFLYNVENDELTQVTSSFFDANNPAFDRDGDFLYYVSSMHFQPEYSDIDLTFVYNESQNIIAVPLNSEVENPWAPEVDEEEFTADDDEANADEDTSEDGDDDNGKSSDDAADTEVHPLQGVWEGTVTGLKALGSPEDEISFMLVISVDEDGNITGYSETMGQKEDLGEVTFDEGSGEFVEESESNGMKSITKCTVKDGEMVDGTVEIPDMGITLHFTATRSSTELDEDQAKDAKKKDKDEPVVIDLDGFESRGIMLPIDNGNFSSLTVNDKNQLIYMRAGEPFGTIQLFDITEKKDGERKVVGGSVGYAMSGDGKQLAAVSIDLSQLQAAQRGGGGVRPKVAVIKAAPSQSMGKAVPMDSMNGLINPRDEWAQILRDAWRIQRDFFYDANMHGVNWQAVYDRYSAMLPDCTTRDDVSFLIREMISELNVGHAYYFGGDTGEHPPQMNCGMLGADYELVSTNEGKAYKITNIVEGAAWDHDARGPLSMPGVDVKEGDFILAVNGVPIDTTKDIYASFQGLAGKLTQLTVSEKPFIDDDARDVFIEPIGGENNLRYRAWIEANRKYVEYKTDGKVGYLYVPNTGVDGQSDLFRQYYGQRDKLALIVDERWNGGGQIPTRFIELMNRPVTNYWAVRDGKDWMWPPDSMQGPKCMLINGLAGSGGDMFPALFRQAGVGKIIGMRTWGGLVGISGNPALIDGGYTSAPTFAYYEKDGTWGIEGHGVDPDIEVIDDPALMIAAPGEVADPQLDAAIQLMLDEISVHRYVPPHRPQPVDRSGMGIREQDK
ncbi:MAG: PD40 domain-containing protein [Phycisphaerales bacterium]|nr:PD40 domain-containing protein [Phycisphaerales bacterium]